MKKERLDLMLVERGLFSSRSRAQGAILAGEVYVEGKRVDKAGTRFPPGVEIEVRGDPLPYVSRGGLKLEGALEEFDLSPRGLTVLDLGASTGGFTDCLLQYGAERVYALDVGYGQLDWSLRQDPRVVVIERVNARYLTPEDFPHPFPLITMDLSFISLTMVLPAVVELLGREGSIIALVKPQFEAGREKVGRGGVVRDPQLHLEILLGLFDFALQLGLYPEGLRASPIRGKKEENIEYLLHLSLQESEESEGDKFQSLIRQAVQDAHST